jgi:hypothetical protein
MLMLGVPCRVLQCALGLPWPPGWRGPLHPMLDFLQGGALRVSALL